MFKIGVQKEVAEGVNIMLAISHTRSLNSRRSIRWGPNCYRRHSKIIRVKMVRPVTTVKTCNP
jgi:hypothetical protein